MERRRGEGRSNPKGCAGLGTAPFIRQGAWEAWELGPPGQKFSLP